jgi:hypothetical protein
MHDILPRERLHTCWQVVQQEHGFLLAKTLQVLNMDKNAGVTTSSTQLQSLPR